MQPKVSVSMAVYNNARYLQESVESILNQTFTDFEFLIIDDGSTDHSHQILQDYAAKDQRIRLTSRSNKGIPKTRNEMLVQARAEFVAVMDADDVALPERLARQVEFLQHHASVVCVSASQVWIDPEGDLLTYMEPPTDDAELQKQLLAGKNLICHPCALIRRSAMLQVNGYNEAMSTSSDLDLCLKLGEVGELANLPDTLLKYRIHPGGVSEQRMLQQSNNAHEACKRAWQRRGIEGRYEVEGVWRHSFILSCGWQMFNQRQRRKAIAYGIRAIKTIPLNLESWRLLICALIKPLPEAQIL